MKPKVTLAATGLGGMFAGVLMVSGGIKLQTVSLAGLLAAPVAVAGLIIADSKAQSKINAVEDKASQAQRTLDAERSRANAGETREAKLRLELAEIQRDFARAKDLLKVCEQERCQSSESITQLNGLIAQLQTSLGVNRERVDELEAEVEAWEQEFSSRTDTEAESRYQKAKQAEIKRIEAENDEITREAMEIAKAYREWAVEVDDRLQDRGEYIKSVTNQYNNHLDGLKGSVSTQVQAYLEQIEILNCKVAALQQKLAGDLLEPEYGKFGYQWDARIADDIARRVWESLHIPLSVKGFRINPDGSAEAGYGYSRSQSVEALARDLTRISGDMAKGLGIHKISSVRKHDLSDLLIVSWRREAPVKEDEIKRLLTPADKLATQVLREMSRKSTIRIMGATGDGKGVCARFLLSRIVSSLDWYVRLHDPQDGSAEDYWGIPKVSTNGKELKQSLKAITRQMEEREVSKVHNPVTLDILDEIDTQLEKEDKGQFLNLISRIRHLGMKMILIGQNPKVSRAGFQWADMEQMIAFYQGSSALDAIKNNPALELKREILFKQYEEISAVFQAKNEWLDDAKKHYFGLCVIPGKSPQWYELPIADEIEIDAESELLAESFSVPNSLAGFIDITNNAQSPSSSALTDRNSKNMGKRQTFAHQSSAPIIQTPDYGGSTAQTAQSAPSALTTCKTHPQAKLRECKDGRFYCPSCKKKLSQSQVDYR